MADPPADACGERCNTPCHNLRTSQAHELAYSPHGTTPRRSPPAAACHCWRTLWCGLLARGAGVWVHVIALFYAMCLLVSMMDDPAAVKIQFQKFRHSTSDHHRFVIPQATPRTPLSAKTPRWLAPMLSSSRAIGAMAARAVLPMCGLPRVAVVACGGRVMELQGAAVRCIATSAACHAKAKPATKRRKKQWTIKVHPEFVSCVVCMLCGNNACLRRNAKGTRFNWTRPFAWCRALPPPPPTTRYG